MGPLKFKLKVKFVYLSHNEYYVNFYNSTLSLVIFLVSLCIALVMIVQLKSPLGLRLNDLASHSSLFFFCRKKIKQ